MDERMQIPSGTSQYMREIAGVYDEIGENLKDSGFAKSRFEQYKSWQEKVLYIGARMRERGFLDERDRKLWEEPSEMTEKAGIYLSVHPGRKHHHEDKRKSVIEEMYDFVNVASIIGGTINENLPVLVMLKRLDFYNQKYGTPQTMESIPTKIGTTPGKDTENDIFRLLEGQLFAINRHIQQEILNGSYTMDERWHTTVLNILGGVKDTQDCISTMPSTYGEFEVFSRGGEIIKDPIFDFRVAMADVINNAAIGMGVFGDPIMPYSEMHKKLISRDERYKTGSPQPEKV